MNLDAIRARAKMTLDNDDLPPLACGVLGGDLPALCDEVERLRAQLAELATERETAIRERYRAQEKAADLRADLAQCSARVAELESPEGAPELQVLGGFDGGSLLGGVGEGEHRADAEREHREDEEHRTHAEDAAG